MQESKLSMMKRKSIQEAINKGESLPPVMEKSKMETNKHNLQYQARLIDYDIILTKILMHIYITKI